MTNLKNLNYNCGEQKNSMRPTLKVSLMTLMLLLLCLLNGRSQVSNLIAKIPQDKALHFTGGFMISATTSGLLNEAGVKNAHLYGLVAGIGAGLIKEAIDTTPDPNDFYATAAGAISGTIIIYLPIRKRK